MRLAVLHDHLRFIGGGERSAVILASALDADIFVTDLNSALPRKAGLPQVRAAEIARVPITPLLRQSRQIRAFRDFAPDHYDGYILSGNWAVFAAGHLRPNLWYCYTPARVFYDLRGPFLRDLTPLKRWAAKRWIEAYRPLYEEAVSRVERIVAISQNVAGRVERYFRRSSPVVYPPVDVSRYRFESIGDFWLSVNRLSHEKRLRLQMETFRRLPRDKLVVVGGPRMGVDLRRAIRSLDPPGNVTFLGEIEEHRLLDLYATCRGLVATSQDEDFGLSPVEAMASGKAVVAVDEGGYRESVVAGETGWLVPATPEALCRAIESATPERMARAKDDCQERAKSFDVSSFVANMQSLVDQMVREGTRVE